MSIDFSVQVFDVCEGITFTDQHYYYNRQIALMVGSGERSDKVRTLW